MKALLLSVLIGFSAFASAIEFDSVPRCHAPVMSNEALASRLALDESSKILGKLKLMVFKQKCSSYGGCYTPELSPYFASDSILATYTYVENDMGRPIEGPVGEDVELLATRNGEKVELEFIWQLPRAGAIATVIRHNPGDLQYYFAKHDKAKTFQLGMHERFKRIQIPFGNRSFNFDNTGCIYLSDMIQVEASSSTYYNYYFFLSGRIN